MSSAADVHVVNLLGPALSKTPAPKHRGAPTPRRRTRSRGPLRGLLLASGTAALATGLAVSTGVATHGAPQAGSAAAVSAPVLPAQRLSQAELMQRERQVSRSSDRTPAVDPGKAKALSGGSGVAVTRTQDLSAADPKTLAKALMPSFGMSPSEFGCLDNIWSQESGWNVHADNPSSSAYGIPQALPGSKMASAGPNWADNPETQIRWGLGYIRSRYGSACAAWSFKQGAGWY